MASAWEPLKNNIFRNLFIAQLVSNVGLWMQSVGAQWFLVDNHAGPTVISLAQTASLAPTLVLSLLAGVLADLLDRKWLLVVTSVYEFPAQGAGDGRQRKHHDTRRGSYCQDLWMGEFQAASSESELGSGSTSLPFSKVAPSRTSFTRCGALTARHFDWAASINL